MDINKINTKTTSSPVSHTHHALTTTKMINAAFTILPVIVPKLEEKNTTFHTIKLETVSKSNKDQFSALHNSVMSLESNCVEN